MQKRQYGLLLVLAITAGVMGGTVSNRLFMNLPAFAQKASQQGEVIRAERLEVVDKSGKRRAWFGLAPHGNAGLGLYDQNENISATLTVTPERTTGLILVNKDGNRRAGLVLSAEDEPTLELYDKDKKCRMKLALATGEEPQLWLNDRNENPRIAVGLSPDGSATLGVANSDHKATISFEVEADGRPSLNLTDHEGRLRATLGNTGLNVLPEETWEKKIAPSLLLDPKGQILAEIP